MMACWRCVGVRLRAHFALWAVFGEEGRVTVL